MSQLQCRAAPWGGHCSFYIFPEIFRLCATCPLPPGEGVWRLAILTVGGRPLPLGGEGGPPPAFSSAGAGRVRGWWACAPPFAVHIAPLKALGNDHATSSTLSRNPGTALRCLWFRGIDPLIVHRACNSPHARVRFQYDGRHRMLGKFVGSRQPRRTAADDDDVPVTAARSPWFETILMHHCHCGSTPQDAANFLKL